MSAIQGISSATISTSSAGATSAAGGVAAQGGVNSLGGVMGQQASSLLSISSQQSPAEALGAMLIAMLLSKSNESKDKQDPMALLAGMAMLGAALQQGANSAATNLTMMSSVTTAYSGGGPSAVSAGCTLNVQA